MTGKPQGSMLVMALWMLSLLGLFSISLGFGVRQKAALLNRLSTLDAVYPIAYSGVELAKSLVRTDDNFDVDIFTDTWASGSQKRELDGGSFSLGTDGPSPVVDEERKVNLNHTSAEVLGRLLQRVSGLDRDEAEALGYNLQDWMDSDSFFGHPQHGAEDSYYDGLPLPYAAKDAAYETLDELLLVKDMTEQVFGKIRPYVTVYGSGKVNLNTAGRQVLSALGFSEAAVQAIVQYRAGADGQEGTGDDSFFSSPGSIESALEQAGTPLDVSQVVFLSGLMAADSVGVVSTVFSVQSVGIAARNGAQVDVEAFFDRKGRTLYQRAGEVRWPARS